MTKRKTLVTVEDIKEAAVTKTVTPMQALKDEIVALKAALSSAQFQVGDSNLNLLRAKVFLSDILKPCPVCGERALMLDWNVKVVLLICGNMRCQKYHVPIRNVLKEYISWCGDILGDIQYSKKQDNDA